MWLTRSPRCPAFHLPALTLAAALWAAAVSPARAQTRPAPVSALAWLEGRWLGSGGGYSAFYEEYRVVNDSTIEQREIADSSFSRITSRSLIAHRGGQWIKQNAEGRQTAEIRVAGDTAFFTAGPRSYRWIRTGEGEWRAELGRVTYLLRRIGR